MDSKRKGWKALKPPLHVAVGNINVDIYLKVPKLPAPDDAVSAEEATVRPGGAAANYSVAVARLGHRARLVAHTSRIAELLGVLDTLRGSGVDTSTVKMHEEGMPGMVLILLLPGGETSMIKLRGVNALLSGVDVRDALPADVVHFASVAPSILVEAAGLLRGLAGLVSYDPGGAVVNAYGPEVVEAAREAADVLTINRNELKALTGGWDPVDARRLLGGRLRYVLVRVGGRGAYLATDSRVYWVKPYIHGVVVDTTGAGDVFNAYFLGFMAEGREVREALAAASIAAGIKVTRLGAQSAPYRREVEEVLEEYGGELVEEIY